MFDVVRLITSKQQIFSVRSSPDLPIFKKIAVRSSPDPPKVGFSPDPCSSLLYWYRNFAILIQSETFSSTPYTNHIQKVKIMDSDPISNPNPKPLTQLHISLQIL